MRRDILRELARVVYIHQEKHHESLAMMNNRKEEKNKGGETMFPTGPRDVVQRVRNTRERPRKTNKYCDVHVSWVCADRVPRRNG